MFVCKNNPELGEISSNPNYTQLQIYVERKVLLEVKRKLVGSEQDVSDLVNSLLAGWLARKKH